MTKLPRVPAVLGRALAHTSQCSKPDTAGQALVRTWLREFGLWQKARMGILSQQVAALQVANRPTRSFIERAVRDLIARLIMAGEWDLLEAAWQFAWNPQAASRYISQEVTK